MVLPHRGAFVVSPSFYDVRFVRISCRVAAVLSYSYHCTLLHSEGAPSAPYSSVLCDVARCIRLFCNARHIPYSSFCKYAPFAFVSFCNVRYTRVIVSINFRRPVLVLAHRSRKGEHAALVSSGLRLRYVFFDSAYSLIYLFTFKYVTALSPIKQKLSSNSFVAAILFIILPTLCIVCFPPGSLRSLSPDHTISKYMA